MLAGLLLAVSTAASPAPAVPVTVENFRRAESDMYFRAEVKRGAFGKFVFNRELTPVDKQSVIRPNRDTLYGVAVFDLEASPVTISLPDPGDRFQSIQVINEDHYTQLVAYGEGVHTLLRDTVATRYAIAAVRILVDPAIPGDFEKAHALQDAIQVRQFKSGAFEVPSWDPVSQKKIRNALLTLGATLSDTRHMFGKKEEVDSARHLIGTALAWGGNPDKDAVYLTVTPPTNDGTTVHRLTVRAVPVEGFWSISVYNAQGYFQKNPFNAYSLNNLTAQRGTDGAIVVRFGGCDGKIPNCLPIMPHWNYTVRLYEPRPDILNGKWTFPEAIPVAK
jgi:hypothetical protein